MSYYVTSENSVLNINNAHLKVSGNIQTDVMKLGAIEFAPPASDVPGTVNFTNVTTGVTTTSNLNVGGTLQLGTVEVVGTPANTANLHDVVNLGNVTSNTVQFTNATTGIVATGNVEASKFIGDGSLLTGITTIESNVDLIRNTDNTAFINLNSNVVTEFPRSKKLIKYPKVVLTANGLNQGYTVSGSSDYSSGLTYYGAFTPPTSSNNPSGAWLTPTSGTTGYNTNYTGAYLLSTQLHSGSLTGEYVQIVLPEKINPVKFTVQPRPESANSNQGLKSCVKEGEIWASNDDGTTWVAVGTIQNFTPYHIYQQYVVDDFSVSGYYDTFALIIHKNNGQTFAGIGEWRIFGVPEYDPDAHGTNVAIKSISNIPTHEWLDVYYDAKFETPGSTITVSDRKSSGTAANASSGTPAITVANNAFVFNGSNYISNTRSGYSGAQTYTAAVWIKPDPQSYASTNSCIFQFGKGQTSTTDTSFGLFLQSHGSIRAYIYGNADLDIFGAREDSKWTHLAATYDLPTGQIELYINGVLRTSKRSGTTAAIGSTPYLIIGTQGTSSNSPNSSAYYEGSIANFRLFNRALISDEIYQLYAYQKQEFQDINTSLTLKAGRLGVGTNQPRAVLDILGDAIISSSLHVEKLVMNGLFDHVLLEEAEIYYDPSRAECQDRTEFMNNTVNDIKGNWPGTKVGITEYNHYWLQNTNNSGIQTNGNVDLRRDWTAMVWFRPADDNNMQYWKILGHGIHGNNSGLHFSGADGTRLRCGMYANDLDASTTTGMSNRREWMCMTFAYFHNKGVAGDCDKMIYQNERLVAHQQGSIGDGHHFGGVGAGGTGASNGHQPYQAAPTKLRFGANFGSYSLGEGRTNQNLGPCIFIPRFISREEVRSLYRFFAIRFPRTGAYDS